MCIITWQDYSRRRNQDNLFIYKDLEVVNTWCQEFGLNQSLMENLSANVDDLIVNRQAFIEMEDKLRFIFL